MQTIKLTYHTSCEEDSKLLTEYRKQFSILIRSAYNRIKSGEIKSEKELKNYLYSLNNIELVNNWNSVNSSMHNAQGIIDSEKERQKSDKVLLKELTKEAKDKKLFSKSKLSKAEHGILKKIKSIKHRKYVTIFGGRAAFVDRMKGNISKEEFNSKKISKFLNEGHAYKHGNSFFSLKKDISGFIFKPKKGVKIDLIFDGLSSSIKKLLTKLYYHQIDSDMPYTVSFSEKNIYISFDEKKLNSIKRKDKITDRILSLDMNPNYIGWSIVDWKDEDYRIIKSGVYSIKVLNSIDGKTKVSTKLGEKRPFTEKRKTEIFNIVKSLIDKGLYYKCETIGIESLNMKTSVAKGGHSKNFNRLVNSQWCRTRFVDNLKKWSNILDFNFQEVEASYSSKFGNILYRKHGLPDMVNASIEIGRRTFEFRRQYVTKTAEKRKTIIHPDLTQFSDVIPKSLEEFGLKENCKDLYELFRVIAKHSKNSELLYRVPFDAKRTFWFKNSSKRSLTEHCEYSRL